MQSVLVHSTEATHSFLSGQNHILHLRLVSCWGKWKKNADKRLVLDGSLLCAYSNWLLYKEQHVLFFIFMVFSCWENCFHITEAAADKYRKLVIGTGIIAKVRNRWIWSGVKELKPSSNSPTFYHGQKNHQCEERKTTTNVNTSPLALHSPYQQPRVKQGFSYSFKLHLQHGCPAPSEHPSTHLFPYLYHFVQRQ